MFHHLQMFLKKNPASEHDPISFIKRLVADKGRGDAGGQSAVLLLPLLLVSVRDHALVHERGVSGLSHVQGQVGGYRLWLGGWPHPHKVCHGLSVSKSMKNRPHPARCSRRATSQCSTITMST